MGASLIKIVLFLNLVFYAGGVFGQENLTKTSDVLVIGGTTGGVSAGIQASRMGVSTLIVEETPWLGGMLTSGGVSATDGNHQLASGIWNEFRENLRKHYGGEDKLFTGWVSNTQFEPHVGDSLFKVMAAREKNLSVVYGYRLIKILKSGNKVIGAIFENDKKNKLQVNAKITIDASDLGDGLALAGAEYDLGMESKKNTGEPMAPDTANDILQDLTWVATLQDFGPGADRTISKPIGYNPEIFKGCCRNDCKKMLSYGRLPNNKFLINWPEKGNDIYLNVVKLNYEQRQKELEKAKERTLEFVYYIQTELGFKNLGLALNEYPTRSGLALVPYHREGRRLKGIQRMTLMHAFDRYRQPLYRTGISVGDYPVDHHHDCNPQAPEIKFPPIPSFNIPMGALIPLKVDGLIVCDKAISVSNLINGSTRLQPVVLLTGQAAGVMAAVAVQGNKNVREINIHQVQQGLLDAHAYLMPLVDVHPDDVAFQSIQRVSVTGILKVKGEPYNWANRTWFYPDSAVKVRELTEGLNLVDPTFTVINDTSDLTFQSALDLLSRFQKKDIRIQADQIFENQQWRTFQPNHILTKRECSLLVDQVARPFECMDIGFDGNFIKKNKY